MSARLSLSMFVFALCDLLAGGLLAEPAAADDYGEGIRAYFAQDFQTSHDRLSAALSGGTRDARCHFFRGLANYKLNRPEAAIADFKTGAQLEMAGFGVDVGQALERVQGPERLELERHRRRARLLARYRQQRPAPTPIPRHTPQRLADVIPRTFPSVSEIPSLSGTAVDTNDPFVDDNSGDSDTGGANPSAGGLRLDDDQPVGTGVAADSDGNEATTENPFGDEADAFPEIPGVGGRQRGIFGSVFRALGKAITGGTDAPPNPSADDASDDSSELDFLDEEPF